MNTSVEVVSAFQKTGCVITLLTARKVMMNKQVVVSIIIIINITNLKFC